MQVRKILCRSEKSLLILILYCHSFVEMAKRGFYSFDKTNINDVQNNKYHLVAYPIQYKISDLQLNLQSFQCTTIDFNIPNSLIDIDLIKISNE